MVTISQEVKDVMVRVPMGVFQQIEQFVKKGFYRTPADFFYVAGQKELDRAIERLRMFEKKDQKSEEVVA